MFVTSSRNENTLRGSSWVSEAPQTIVVSSIDDNMERSYFSNYGADVDFAAPESVIESSMPGLYLYNSRYVNPWRFRLCNRVGKQWDIYGDSTCNC